MRRSSRSRPPSGDVRTKYFQLKGGLNLVDAPITMPQGMVLAAVNYELLSRDGYRRIDGYERFDGQASPTDASYWILNFDAGSAAISEGDQVDGLASGHSGVALIDAVVTSGSYGGGDAAGYLVLTACTGVFQDNEALQVSAATKSTADGVALERGASTPADDATHAQDAIETQRALIGKVGAADGSGPVRGVHVYGGALYAFRDNAAATTCLMWKSSAAGWVQQDLGNRVSFTTGTAAFTEGGTLTGGTSGATATINRVVLQSGSWAGGDAAGYLIIGTVTSGPYQAEAGTDGGGGAATLTGAETANTIQPGGRFEFENYNFYGSTQTQRMYGVSGVDYAFEWDGTVYVPIITGNVTDTPAHLAVNEYHLQLTFPNGSLQNSDTGNPYVWAGGGAAEIGCGDDIVGLKKEVGGALAVICRNRSFALHGKNTAASPWDLKTVSDEQGGIEWTIQRIGRTRYLDDRGFIAFEAVQEFGDFKTGTYSQLIEPLVTAKKNNVVSSIIVKSKSQLRTFFDDGTGIVATFNDNKLAGFTTIRYVNSSGSTVAVRCTANGEDSSGSEVMYFGSDDGYVYQMDRGTSFDGGQVDATFVLTYNNLGTPSYDKQFKKVVIEADGAAGAEIKYNVLLDYSSGRAPAGITLQQTVAASGAYWNDAIWDAFNWAADDVTQIEGGIAGVGRNISLQISSSGTYVAPHTLYGVTYHYIMRKLVR